MYIYAYDRHGISKARVRSINRILKEQHTNEVSPSEALAQELHPGGHQPEREQTDGDVVVIRSVTTKYAERAHAGDCGLLGVSEAREGLLVELDRARRLGLTRHETVLTAQRLPFWARQGLQPTPPLPSATESPPSTFSLMVGWRT